MPRLTADSVRSCVLARSHSLTSSSQQLRREPGIPLLELRLRNLLPHELLQQAVAHLRGALLLAAQGDSLLQALGVANRGVHKN